MKWIGQVVHGVKTNFSNDGEIYVIADDLYIENVTQDKDIIFKTNDGGTATEVMRIDGSTSNVGIGTLSPNKRLDIRTNGVNDGVRLATSTNLYFAQITNGNSETFPVGIINLSYGATTPVRISALSNGLQISGGFTTGGKISFRTATTERMRLTDTGLGIGTSSPSEKLQIDGNVFIHNSNATLKIQEGTAETY